MSTRRRYKNPPIEEALCEFRFEPGQEWDFTIPGKLHAELRDAYPGKPRHQMAIQAAFGPREGQPPNLMFRQGLAKVQLITEDAKRIVGVGPDVLSIHMLKPYQDPARVEAIGWEEFRPRIDQALDAYWRVAEPAGVQRVGVRYINKIVVPCARVEPRRYVLCAPPDIHGLPDVLSNFFGRTEYVYDDGVRLVVTYAITDAPTGCVAFLLDIDVIWQGDEAIAKEDALARADDLRVRERDAFEALITDEARRLFDAD